MLLGFLLGVRGIGALLANGRVRRWAHDGPSGGRTLLLGVAICATGTVLLGVSPWLATDLLLLATIGFGWEVIYVAGSATVRTPPRVSGSPSAVTRVAMKAISRS